ncbi:MAG: acetyl-CoA carboxylase, biotin carboxylase subunit [Solirubrobacteraceae bacterium]|jgi:acetyl-CoA carboxylase biotin carboxylase subunit|nr:acetyl-CoA carboxylase, biotin carboxylase subunit [Solirubrobacteraceae bacterium]
MRRVLIANRGEIAVRIIRAARDLGVETVAVHSTADAGALHVQLADEAVEIGPPPATRSYLDVAAMIDAARATGADAVHPGYGFLAEREDFARACEDAGLGFVGPSAQHIALMGDKATARETARRAGVPTIPGSQAPVSGPDEATTVAEEVGYPVAVKAAGGGGGRGIRIVDDEAALRHDLPLAAQEAGRAFGDSRVYIERFIAPARHVEVQVLGDGARAIHLYERDCSLQRRRQKVIEETPAPGLPAATREAMCAAAVALCDAVGYRSAGTVEFLVDAAATSFFFMEMNTRIQVEHPITEIACGVDLIAEQLRIAAGEPLELAQDAIVPRGCAMELRLTAEDPERDFQPSPGTVTAVSLPAGPWVRVDTWVQPGTVVPPFYDSLLGKIVVWGEDRDRAIARGRRALRELSVEGVTTSAAMLGAVLDAPWFTGGELHTGALEEWLKATPV